MPVHRITLYSKQVPRNAKGGILVCEEELKAAFDFFDVDMKGVITASNLRKRLGAFHRSLSARVGHENVLNYSVRHGQVRCVYSSVHDSVC